MQGRCKLFWWSVLWTKALDIGIPTIFHSVLQKMNRVLISSYEFNITLELRKYEHTYESAYLERGLHIQNINKLQKYTTNLDTKQNHYLYRCIKPRFVVKSLSIWGYKSISWIFYKKLIIIISFYYWHLLHNQSSWQSFISNV